METLDPNSNPNSPNKRLKTEKLALKAPIPSSIDKGKAPIIAENDDDGESENGCKSPANSTPENCGVCFSEEGEMFRGLIDSCDHYFCFLCIVEWSKIESRCPLCRGRFSTIRRVRKDGSFIGEGSVRVPVRDQIYDPFGEPVDPYAQAKCSVCNGTTDESLLLLCDLCDSASHTYCVGLGATVPEGDWYCRDCALLQVEQQDNEPGDHGITSTVSDDIDGRSPTLASVSIFDIVRDPSESKEPNTSTNRLLKLVSQDPTKFSASAIISDQQSITSARSAPCARGNLHASVDVSDSSARTLRNCRNVRRHINVLRDNWDAVRSGSLSFSFALSDSVGKGSQKKNVVGTSTTKSSKSQSFSSSGSLQSKAVDSSCDASLSKESYNVERAWKLMTMAKTAHLADKSKRTSMIAQNKPHHVKQAKFVAKCAVSGRKDLISHGLNKQKPIDMVSGRPVRSVGLYQFTGFVSQGAYTSGNPESSGHREIQTASEANPHDNRVIKPSSLKLHERLGSVLDDGSALSASSCEPIVGAADVSCTKLQRREVSPVKNVGHLKICTSNKGELRTEICSDKAVLFSHENLGRQLSNITDEKNGYACSTSSYEPLRGGSDLSHVKLEGNKRSACHGEVGGKINSKGIKNDETKREIQSLVKLNLKLLSKDKRLGVDAFKEIARVSTHTILASCGFEHRKIVRSLPTLVCHHGDRTLYRSAIVPSSCRECFYVFVKDVVNSIMSEKLNNAGAAS